MDAVLRGAALAATLMQAGEARARPTDHEYYIPCTGKVVDSSALESMELCLLCGGSGQVWQNRTLAPKIPPFTRLAVLTGVRVHLLHTVRRKLSHGLPEFEPRFPQEVRQNRLSLAVFVVHALQRVRGRYRRQRKTSGRKALASRTYSFVALAACGMRRVRSWFSSRLH